MAVFYTGRGSGGVKLPSLTNPASASEIGEGYDAINAAGERVVGTGELAVNLNPELTAQDTLIADIMTALEGKTAGGGAKVVTGVYTHEAVSAATATITIPGLIGKENFCILFRGALTTDEDLLSHTILHYWKLSNADEFYYCFYLTTNDQLITEYTINAAWDSTTGTLTPPDSSPAHKFRIGDWFYIGW